MNTPKKIFSRLKTISLYGFSQILNMFSVLLLSLIIIKFNGNELWGRYVEIFIWTNLFLVILNFGSHDFLLKSFSNIPKEINQNWGTNFWTRCIFLVPTYFFIHYITIFKGLENLIFTLIAIQFISQSFKVLILFYRYFKFSIKVELLYNIIIVVVSISIISKITLNTLLLIIILAQIIKTLCYAYFFQKDLKKIKFQIRFKLIKQSFPFFIPIMFGTLRSKIDAYYGTLYFNFDMLSKYQVFISFLTLAQVSSAFVLNPFLKNLYRSKSTLIFKLQKKMFILGWPFAFIFTHGMYFVIEYIYKLQFSFNQYLLAFLFIIPTFIHVLLINEYYKKNKQNQIAAMTSILTIILIILGYYLVNTWFLNGVLILKVLGNWSIIVLLWLWIKRNKTSNHISTK